MNLYKKAVYKTGVPIALSIFLCFCRSNNSLNADYGISDFLRYYLISDILTIFTGVLDRQWTCPSGQSAAGANRYSIIQGHPHKRTPKMLVPQFAHHSSGNATSQRGDALLISEHWFDLIHLYISHIILKYFYLQNLVKQRMRYLRKEEKQR